MDDYAAWRSRVLRGPPSSSLPRESNSAGPSVSPRPPTPTYTFSSAGASHCFPAAGVPPPPPPLVSAAPHPSSNSMPSADVSARLSEVLQDIAATERGQERAWLNVQPCVLHTVKLLAAAAQSREAQLQQLADTVHEAQECLSILVRDREVKEERYRLDIAAHRTESEQLWRRVLLLEAQQQQQQQQAMSSSTSPPSVSQSPALEERLALLEHELHNVQRQLQVSPPQRPRSARRPPSARSSSSLSTSSANSTQRGVGDGDLTAPSPVSRTMVAEVQQLRRQWRHFLHSVPQAAPVEDSDEAVDDAEGNVYTRNARAGGVRSPTLQHTTAPFNRQRAASIRKKMRDLFSDPAVNSDDAADTEEHDAYGGGAPHRDRVHRGVSGILSSAGRRVRWYWAGEVQGRVPTAANLSPYSRAAQRAQRRAGTGEAPPVLPWTEWHAFDGRTDCWYSLGTWATHRQQLRAVEQAEEEEAAAVRPTQQHARFGWVARAAELVTWTQPARITIQRGGVYEVRVCLVRHRSAPCTTGSTNDVQEAALTLCVNGEAVAGVRPSVSSIFLYAQSPTRHRPSPLRETKMSNSGRHACGCSSGGHSSLPQHTHMEEAYRSLQRRPCCQPAQLQTHTITTCLYLPAGVEVQVRCREPPTTHSLCEAFCELAYVV